MVKRQSILASALSTCALVHLLGCMVPIGPKSVRITSDAPNTTVEVRELAVGQGPDDGWTTIGVIAESGGELHYTDDRSNLQFRATAPGCRERIIARTDLPPALGFDLRRDTQTPRSGTGQTPDSPVIDIGVPRLPAFSGNQYAMIIGVSQYRSSGLCALSNAKADAVAVFQMLTSEDGGNMDRARVGLLVDEEATRARILRDLDRMLFRTRASDMIMIYFAGHGGSREGARPRRFLMAYDSEPDRIDTGVDQEEILEMLDRPDVARRQFVVLDCFTGSGSAGLRIVRPESLWDGLAAAGRVVMTSTRGDETALDGPTGDGSPFAAAFLEAVRNRSADSDDNGLTAEEVFNSVFARMRTVSHQTSVPMTPQLYGREWADKLPLVSIAPPTAMHLLALGPRGQQPVLEGPVEDSTATKALEALLSLPQGFEREHDQLVGERANLTALKSYLRDLARHCKERDTLVIYYAGTEGSPDSASISLAPGGPETGPRSLNATELARLLDAPDLPRRQLVILDCSPHVGPRDWTALTTPTRGVLYTELSGDPAAAGELPRIGELLPTITRQHRRPGQPRLTANRLRFQLETSLRHFPVKVHLRGGQEGSLALNEP